MRALPSRRVVGAVASLAVAGGVVQGIAADTASAAAGPRPGARCTRTDAGRVVGELVCRPEAGPRWVWRRAPLSTPSPPPVRSSRCDPNYEPCVPVASDVDCSSGSGNGPAFVRGPVRVIGRDIYGLDRDGDGIGCERG